VDYVALGLDALTAPSTDVVTGALVPVDHGRGLMAVGAAIVGALAILGIGGALSPKEGRAALLTKWGYNPNAPEPLLRSLDKVREESSRIGLSVKAVHRNLDEEMIRQALMATNGNRTHAAKMLDTSRRWLLYKIKDYNIKIKPVTEVQAGLFEARPTAAAPAAAAVPAYVPPPPPPPPAPGVIRRRAQTIEEVPRPLPGGGEVATVLATEATAAVKRRGKTKLTAAEREAEKAAFAESLLTPEERAVLGSSGE